MGSSVGSLSGNQEMGNGDAEVHGCKDEVTSFGQEVEYSSRSNPLPAASLSASGSGTWSNTRKNQSRDGKAMNRKAIALQNVKEALDELEIDVDAVSGSVTSTPDPVNSGNQSIREELSINSATGLLTQDMVMVSGSAKYDNAFADEMNRDQDGNNSNSVTADDTIEPLPLPTSKKDKNKKTRGRKKTKPKLSPSKYYPRTVAIPNAKKLDRRSSGKNKNNQLLAGVHDIDNNSSEKLEKTTTVMISKSVTSENDSTALPNQSTGSGGCNTVAGSRKKSKTTSKSKSKISSRSNSQTDKPIKKILKAKRKNPVNPIILTSSEDQQKNVAKRLRQVEINNLLMKKMQDTGLGSPKFHGLTKIIWMKIINYLGFADLKTLRLVSPDTNDLVELSLPWAINACFVCDGGNKAFNDVDAVVCPPDLICDDNTLGWPDIRMKNIKGKFSVQTFWFNPDVRNSIKYLEILNCRLSWQDYYNLLINLQCLEDLSIILTEDFIRQNDVYVTLVGKPSLDAENNLRHDLDKNYNIHQDLLSADPTKPYYEIASLDLESKKTTSASKIKKVYLHVLNLEFVNILLLVLQNRIYKGLQELRIVLSNDLFLNIPFHPVPMSSRFENELQARNLIEQNQETLKILQISFDRETSTNSALKTVFGPTLPMICNLLSPGYKKLSLQEIIIDLPINVPLHLADEALFNFGLDNEKYQQSVKTLAEFCTSQKALRRLKLSRINLSSESSIPYILVDALNNSSCDFDLGGKLHSDESDNCLPKWNKLQNVLVDINIVYAVDIHALDYNQLISETMPVMKKTQRFELRSCAKTLKAFEIPIIASKFPNLTRLVLGDSRIRAEGLKFAPKIDDHDFQAIILHLPKLVELVIKCNMSRFSDYGLTGISPSACRRMMNDNSFKRKPGDVAGHSLSKLKKLEVLELHGIGELVTNVSAYLAFKDLHSLEELYLFSPKFSRLAKKLLKERFRLRNGFTMIVN